jgi:hypothetical protein
MEATMKPDRDPIPKTDSIEELARFWDTHSAADYEDEFEDVEEPIFVANGKITVDLPPGEAEAVSKLAESKGVTETELVRGWVLEKLHAT